MRLKVDDNMVSTRAGYIYPWNLVIGHGIYAYPTGKHPYHALKLQEIWIDEDKTTRPQEE